MPYYGDVTSPYYYSGSSTGPFANHSSLISSIGRYHSPIAARYSPHLSTISETPFVTLRRYSPSVPTTATTSTASSLSSRPRRIIDTADIDVSKPPISSSSHGLDHRQQRHRLRRDRPTIKIRSQALKDNPALREYNERHEKTVGEMLVEKFLIKDKSSGSRDVQLPKIKLYHQPSLALSNERENEILAAIRHRITRKMTRRRSSVDAIPLDPEQIEREAALQAAQAEALDSLVAEELAEAEIEVRKGTFTKRHSLVVPLSGLEVSEDSGSEGEEEDEEERKISSELLRKHATAKKKRRRKSIDKYSRSDDEEDEDTFSIAESIIEEEEFEWDDREKCDDIKKIMPKSNLAEMKVPELKHRAVSPRMDKTEKLDEVGNRLKELRKEVRKLDKKDRDVKEKSELEEKLKTRIEESKMGVVKPRLKEVKVEDKVEEKVTVELDKEKEVLKEETVVKDEANEELKKEVVKPEMEEAKVQLKKEEKKNEMIKVEETKVIEDEHRSDATSIESLKEISSKPINEITSKPSEVISESSEVISESSKILRSKDKVKVVELPKDDSVSPSQQISREVKDKTTLEASDKKCESPESKVSKVKERKLKDKTTSSKLKRTTSAPQPTEPQSPGFKVEACNSVGDFSTLYVKASTDAQRASIEQFRESIRLPAPKARASTIETEVVLAVRKPYVRDTSRNSAYLALKPPTRKELASDAKEIIKEEGDIERIEDDDRVTDDYRRAEDVRKSDSCAPSAKEEFISWWDETPEEKRIEPECELDVKKSDRIEQKKLEVEASSKVTTAVSKVKIEPVVEKKIPTNKIADKKLESKIDKETVIVKKIEKVVEPIAEKKITDKKLDSKIDNETVIDKKIEKVVEPIAEKKIPTNKIANKKLDSKIDNETVIDKKIEKVVEPIVGKKITTNKITDKKLDNKIDNETVIDKKIGKVVEPIVEKKTPTNKITGKKSESKINHVTVLDKKIVEKIVEPTVDKKITTNKITDKKLEGKTDNVTVLDKKIVEKVEEPIVEKKSEVKTEKKIIESVQPDKKVQVDKIEKKSEVVLDSKSEADDQVVKVNTEVKSNVRDISLKAAIVSDSDKSSIDDKAKPTTEQPSALKEASTSAAEEHPKKSLALPRVSSSSSNDQSDKTITRSNKSTSDVSNVVVAEESSTIIASTAKRDERKRKVDAQAIMKIEKRILEEAESPDKILTVASLDREDDTTAKVTLDSRHFDTIATKEKSATEIDFWNEIEQQQKTTAVESQSQLRSNLKLDLTSIDESLQDELLTPLIQDSESTPLIEQPATPLEENLSAVPEANLRLTEEERRSTIKYNGIREDEQLDELSGTVKKISKWGNHDNLSSLDSNVTPVASKDASPAVSNASSVTKKKIVKKKKSTTTKKSGEGTKKTADSTKKTSAKTKVTVKKSTPTSAAQPSQSKSSVMSTNASSRNTPVQRPADLQKLFYTTPAILLTATPRDLRKVRRAKAKKKKPPATRTPSLSSDSTGSTRSTATTSTEEGSNCEEDAEQKRLNSTRSNDSGFDGSPRLSNCDMVCHKKCEKLTGNLCGLNQKLVAEALLALKKGPTYTRAGRKSFVRRRLRPYGYPVDPYQQLPPHPETPSQSADNQRNAEGDHFHHSGRITPPATNLPRFKKYEVTDFNFLKVLGKGSFGKVLLAELRGTECVYAVKCLKKDVVLEDDDVECTLIERKVLTLATRHPYLCHLFCTFQTESHLFFVMEYLNGGDLMFHIQKSGRFTEQRAKFYAAEIWSGLIFLHKKGIVYRDLKLDNVLLDFEGHIRIADFGMCKLQIFLDRTADTFCGTPDYMAPEIIKGLKYNQAVDWWSFGVLLYEMLTGQSPFSGCDEDELFWSICNERPFIPRYLSQSSTEILVSLLEKDAGKRIPGHEIACHTFFCNISWEKLERRVLEPPFKPAVEHTLDTRYFDTAFTTERPRLTPVPEEILTSMDQAVFRGFSYTNPNATD